jgi:DNA-binding NtrC family response regulator
MKTRVPLFINPEMNGLKNPSAARESSGLRVLVTVADSRNRHEIAATMVRCGLQPIPLSTVAESRQVLAQQPVSLVLCEEMLADGSYREILREMDSIATKAPVIVVSRLADWDRYLEAMRWGAFDYLAYPCRPIEVESIVGRALHSAPLFP